MKLVDILWAFHPDLLAMDQAQFRETGDPVDARAHLKIQFVGKFAGARARVYPGTSIRKSIDLSAVSGGTYKALVVADADEDSVYGATYTLKLGRAKAAK